MPAFPEIPAETVGLATFIANSGQVTNGANVNVALPAVVGKTNWITGVDVQGTGATAGSTVVVTLTGLVNSPSWGLGVSAGINSVVPSLAIRFPTPIPANAANQAVTLIVPGLGSGNLSTSASIYGFVQ